MGYLSNGQFIQSDDYGRGLQEEILREARQIYRDWYGKRSVDTLSTMELDRVKTEAGKRVMRRRRQSGR